MDFSAINNLKLKAAFNDVLAFSKAQNNDDFLNELFENDNRGTIYVCDCEDLGHSKFIIDTKGIGNNKIFTITNPLHQDVFLWHIDGVVFAKNEKCDCAVLTNKELFFIEFKTNAVLKSNESREENHRKACNQLLNTISEVQTRCQNVGVDLLKTVAIEAYAVFNNTIPRCSATQKRYSAYFLSKSRGIKLKFDNSKKLK